MKWERCAVFTGHRGAVYALERTANPHLFLSGSGDGHVVRWDLRSPEKGELVADAVHAVFALHHDVERKLLFIGNENGGLHVIDLVASEEIRLLQAHKRGIFSMTRLTGDRLVCTAGDGSISVWKLPTMELERHIPLCEEKVRGSALSPDGKLLAVACGDGSVRVLETKNFNEKHTIEAHAKGAASVAWHPGKTALVSGGRDGYLRFWRTDKGYEPLQAFAAHRANIYGIAFNNDASLCATASRDKSVKIWDAKSFDPLAKLDLSTQAHTHSVNTVRWCMDGSLLTASDDRRIMRWTALPIEGR